MRRCAMRTAAGECGDESRAARRFNGARTRAVHVLVARSARSGRALSESASTDDLSQRYGQPYAQRGHVCVRCMVLCVALCVPGGQRVSHITCRDGRPLPCPKKVDPYYTNFSGRFWTVCPLPVQRVRAGAWPWGLGREWRVATGSHRTLSRVTVCVPDAEVEVYTYSDSHTRRP